MRVAKYHKFDALWDWKEVRIFFFPQFVLKCTYPCYVWYDKILWNIVKCYRHLDAFSGVDSGMGWSAPPPSFWQLNHVNSTYFGAISANYNPILTLCPPLIANPGSSPDFAPFSIPQCIKSCDILLLAITIFKTRLLKKIRCKKLYSSGAIIHLPSAEQWLRGRSRYELNRPCPPPPIWQLNHANSAYFGAISANYPPILTLSPLFFSNPGSGPERLQRTQTSNLGVYACSLFMHVHVNASVFQGRCRKLRADFTALMKVIDLLFNSWAAINWQ